MESMFDFSKVECPICGKNDIELYMINMTGNFYRCKSTEREIEFETRTYFKEASDWKKRLACASKNK